MIEYAIFSDKGEQAVNEDTVRIFVNPRLGAYGFVLADGLGGHGGGKLASEIVTAHIGKSIENAADYGGIFMDECFADAQEHLVQEAELNGHIGMRTTLVTMILCDNVAQWGHIGDSRLYFFREGKLIKQTLDHSVPQLLVNSGQIKSSSIRRHPDRSKLLRAMGGEWDGPEYEIDERVRRVRPGDSFLLCSDGFWDWIDEKTMSKLLKKGANAQTILKEMADEVRIKGTGHNMDNYSAILVMIR